MAGIPPRSEVRADVDAVGVVARDELRGNELWVAGEDRADASGDQGDRGNPLREGRVVADVTLERRLNGEAFGGVEDRTGGGRGTGKQGGRNEERDETMHWHLPLALTGIGHRAGCHAAVHAVRAGSRLFPAGAGVVFGRRPGVGPRAFRTATWQEESTATCLTGQGPGGCWDIGAPIEERYGRGTHPMRYVISQTRPPARSFCLRCSTT